MMRGSQLERLGTGIQALLTTNRFYRERLHPVHTWDDFERLPLTTKDEITADQHANPPFGTNLTFPIDRYSRLHQTSGTSGTTPLRWLDTSESWDWWVRIWADEVYRSAGVQPRDRIFFAFSFGPFIGFWSAFSGAERLGALVIPGGATPTHPGPAPPREGHAERGAGGRARRARPRHSRLDRAIVRRALLRPHRHDRA